MHKLESLKDRDSQGEGDLKRIGQEKQSEKHKYENFKYFSVIQVWWLAMHVGVLFVSLLHSKLSLY